MDLLLTTALNLIKSLDHCQKRTAFLTLDLMLVPLALWLTAMVLAEQGADALQHLILLTMAALLSPALGIPRIRLNGYDTHAVLRTAGLAIVLGGIAFSQNLLRQKSGNISDHIQFAMVFFLLSAGARMVLMHLLNWLYGRHETHARVLIYGAGTTGLQLASALRGHRSIHVEAFVDDSKALQGATFGRLRVHAPDQLERLVARKGIDRILLAMPALSAPKQARLVRRLQRLKIEVQALPSFAQLIGTEALVDTLAPVSADSFLGRADLSPDINPGTSSYRGQTILVSGAGGSIGSEICRQILTAGPARLILLEQSEFALYSIEKELRALGICAHARIIPVLGSVTDAPLLARVLTRYKVQVIMHSAAYKHVPLVEANPMAGMQNNVIGTLTLARAAQAAGVERFILISSDKAVRPSNMMGASKRLAEMVIQDMASRTDTTIFTMVRFGNVLGSSGSVIPLFKDQIRRGGPVTITDPRVTRYFMTVQEAVGLVLRAGALARGGEVYVLDMGQPVAILDLAHQLIKRAGFTLRNAKTPDGDIEIRTIGLRPGEKLHEELLIGEGARRTAHPKILCAQERGLSRLETAAMLRDLHHAITRNDPDTLRQIVERWVETEPQSAPALLAQ